MSLFTEFTVLAEASPGAFQLLIDFLSTGGYVMLLIVLCSMVVMACIIIASLQLRQSALLPKDVVKQLKALPDYAAKGDILPLQQFLERDGSLLACIGTIAISGHHTSKQDCTEACAAKAKEALNGLEQGIPYLEVMVSVAPLLGLLGTTIGMVGMFTEFGAGGESGADTGVIAREIGVALRCTIAGLFVAVPSVIAHTLFMRKLDTIAVRLETLIQETVNSFYHYFEVSRN